MLRGKSERERWGGESGSPPGGEGVKGGRRAATAPAAGGPANSCPQPAGHDLMSMGSASRTMSLCSASQTMVS